MSPIALLKRLIPDDWKLYARTRRIDGHFRLRTPDRIFLEETIIPWFRDHGHTRAVLDIGCDWYTRAYPALLRAAPYHTIDLDPEKARFARGREADHQVGSLLQLDQHYPPGAYDLVLCNGVLGWGVNDRASIALAARQLARVLRPGGWLVLGWNDRDGYRPETLAPFDTAPFQPFALPPLGDHTHLTPTRSRHTFRILQKQSEAPVAP